MASRVRSFIRFIALTFPVMASRGHSLTRFSFVLEVEVEGSRWLTVADMMQAEQ